MSRGVAIVSAVRTAVGKAPRGSLKDTRPDELLGQVLKGCLDRVPGLDPARIDDVVIGTAMPEAEQGMNVARIGVLLAGLPDSVPAMTINRFCASGVQAVALAADRIRTGDDDVVIAAGTESMSMVPMMGNKVALNDAVFAGGDNVAIAYGMGITAENVAKQWKVSREEQDATPGIATPSAVAASTTREVRRIALLRVGRPRWGVLPAITRRPGGWITLRRLRDTRARIELRKDWQTTVGNTVWAPRSSPVVQSRPLMGRIVPVCLALYA